MNTFTDRGVSRRNFLRSTAAAGSLSLAGCTSWDRSREIIPRIAGTWRGDIAVARESNTGGMVERTGFDLRIHSLTVDPDAVVVDYDFDIFPSVIHAHFDGALATARYRHPSISMPGVGIQCTVDSLHRTAQLNGEIWHNQHDEAWFRILDGEDDLLTTGSLTMFDPEDGYIYDTWRWRSELHPFTDEVGSGPVGRELDWNRVTLPLDGARIVVDDVFEDTGPSFTERIAIQGTLYRVTTYFVSLGDEVSYDDPIETDKATRYSIEMGSVGEISVDAETKAVFEAPPAGRDIQTLEQFTGALRTKVEGLDAEAMEIRQPQAIAGVRGTELVTEVEADGTCSVTVLEGEVAYADRESRSTVVVGPMQTSRVEPGSPPTEPAAVEPDQIPLWWE